MRSLILSLVVLALSVLPARSVALSGPDAHSVLRQMLAGLHGEQAVALSYDLRKTISSGGMILRIEHYSVTLRADGTQTVLNQDTRVTSSAPPDPARADNVLGLLGIEGEGPVPVSVDEEAEGGLSVDAIHFSASATGTTGDAAPAISEIDVDPRTYALHRAIYSSYVKIDVKVGDAVHLASVPARVEETFSQINGHTYMQKFEAVGTYSGHEIRFLYELGNFR